MTKKIIIIVLSSILGLLVVASIVVFGIMPVTYSSDEELTKLDNTTKIVENSTYTTITKDYSKGEDFKILSFTDLHFDTYKTTGGDITYDLMIKNIKKENPDLIVFDGDIITSALNLRRTKQLCETLESLGVYWTLVLGNHEHDNLFSITRKKMINTMAKYDHCLIDNTTKYTSDGTKVWGYGNHVINILNKDNKISQTLYLVDGGQDMTDEDIEKYKEYVDPVEAKVEYKDGEKRHQYDYDYVKESQITWLKETADDIKKLNNDEYTKGTLFCHIPVKEMEDAWRLYTGEGYRITNACHEKTYSYDSNLLYGERRETVNYSGYNTGLFDAAKSKGVQAIWFGHDHVNDFVLNYEGVTLGYIKCGGYSIYNTLYNKYTPTNSTEKVSTEDHLIQGYTTITINTDGSFTFKQFENYDLYPDLNDYIVANMEKGADGKKKH